MFTWDRNVIVILVSWIPCNFYSRVCLLTIWEGGTMWQVAQICPNLFTLKPPPQEYDVVYFLFHMNDYVYYYFKDRSSNFWWLVEFKRFNWCHTWMFEANLMDLFLAIFVWVQHSRVSFRRGHGSPKCNSYTSYFFLQWTCRWRYQR